MRHKKTWYSCDICGAECVAPWNTVRINLDGGETLLLELNEQAYKDLCKKCLIRLLKQWIEEQEADNDTE